MVKLHTSRGGGFEYTGCNSKVTVVQLKAYLKFMGLTFNSQMLKKDLCRIVQRQIQQKKQPSTCGCTNK